MERKFAETVRCHNPGLPRKAARRSRRQKSQCSSKSTGGDKHQVTGLACSVRKGRLLGCICLSEPYLFQQISPFGRCRPRMRLKYACAQCSNLRAAECSWCEAGLWLAFSIREPAIPSDDKHLKQVSLLSLYHNLVTSSCSSSGTNFLEPDFRKFEQWGMPRAPHPSRKQ